MHKFILNFLFKQHFFQFLIDAEELSHNLYVFLYAEVSVCIWSSFVHFIEVANPRDRQPQESCK